MIDRKRVRELKADRPTDPARSDPGPSAGSESVAEQVTAKVWAAMGGPDRPDLTNDPEFLDRVEAEYERSQPGIGLGRDRVRKAAGRPADDATSAKDRPVAGPPTRRYIPRPRRPEPEPGPSGGKPWREVYDVVRAAVVAPTIEDFEQVRPKFRRAYGELWQHCRKKKTIQPKGGRYDRVPSKDMPLWRAMHELWEICSSSSDNLLPRMEARTIQWKVRKLCEMCFGYKRKDDEEASDH